MRHADQEQDYDFQWLNIPIWVFMVGFVIYVVGMSEW